MRCSTVKSAIISVLIFSVVFTLIVPAFADSKKVKVAFAGITFEELPAEVEKRLLERITNLLKEQSSFLLLQSTDIEKVVGKEWLESFLENQDQSSFAALAEQLQVDYVFGGRISNNNRDGERILITGDLYRFDNSSQLRHKFEILKYYENIGVELLKFGNEFVQTITLAEEPGKILPYLVLASVAVAGIALFALVKIDKGGSGSGNQRPPDVP